MPPQVVALDYKKKEMIPFIIILSTAVIYALIRAKHDYFVPDGKWKLFAFIEGVFFDLIISALTVAAFDLSWWMGFPLAAIFAFVFWLFFDCAVGYYFSGSILYLGNSAFDLKMRKMFLYNKPIFGWKSGALILILFKLFWIALLTLSYISLL